MKKLLTVLFVFIGLFASAQKLDSIRGAGFIWERGMFNKSLGIPTVCGVPKTNYTDSTKKAQIIYDSCAGKFYAYNPATESWAEPGGGGVSGVDSVTIVQTGCAFTFYTWQAGVSTAVGTLSQYNGLTPGTGKITLLTDTTVNVDPAIYSIDCELYVTTDTTLRIDPFGDSGRIDVIKVDTSGKVSVGKGQEGSVLAQPPISATELALSYIFITEDSAFSSPPNDTAAWVYVGNEIRNANTGRVRIKRDLQVGNYAPGPWDTTGVHTNTYMVAQDGFYTTNPSNSSLTKNGIGQGFGNAINMWAGSNIIGTWSLVGNGTGNQFRIFGGMNPSTGTGEGNGVLIDPALSPSGANSKSYNMLKIAPTYTQGTFGTGTLRGIYYNPIVTSLNTSTHYFIESTSGLVKLAGIGTEVDTTTWKPMVMNSSGDARRLTYWPVGSGGGGGATTLEDAFINGNVFTQTNRIAAQGNNLYVDSTNEFKVHSQFDRGDASALNVKIAGITIRSEGTGESHNIEIAKDNIGFVSSDSLNFTLNPTVTATPDFALGMIGDRMYRIPVSSASTSDTIYVDAPLEAYTSGDSTKVRVNADTLFKWRYGAAKTFTIDLRVDDYEMTEPGIYLVEHGTAGLSRNIHFPDPALFDGAEITIINADSDDNNQADYQGGNKPYKNGSGVQWETLPYTEEHNYVSIGGRWRGGKLSE